MTVSTETQERRAKIKVRAGQAKAKRAFGNTHRIMRPFGGGRHGLAHIADGHGTIIAGGHKIANTQVLRGPQPVWRGNLCMWRDPKGRNPWRKRLQLRVMSHLCSLRY